MKRPFFLPLAVGAIVFSGIVGVVLFRVTAQAPHSVLLKWNPPPPTPGVTVAGYDVYRDQADGYFKKIASGDPAPSYVDHDVSSGKSYSYYVRAVDTKGNASPPSNQVSATIP